MKNKLLICVMLCMLTLTFAACNTNTSLFTIVFGEGSNEMVGTMGMREYDLKVDRLLTSIFTDAETIMANSKYVVNGSRNVDEEYALVQLAINDVQDVINTVDKIAEPSSRTEDKANLIIDLTAYKNALIQYALCLQSGDLQEISTKASEVMVAISTLKGEWRTYTE